MNVVSSLQVDSAISYVIAVLLPALDAIFPVLPSETAVIALGVTTAGSTDPRIALLVAAAAAGAFLGDNLAYLIGRRFGPAAQRRFFSSPKGKATQVWARRSLERFGLQVIIVCRFIPAGRTAVTVTCGLTGYPRRKFVIGTALAALIWAPYAFFIGRLGGRAFEDRPWAGFLIAFAGTIVVSALVEAVRRIRAWSRDRSRSRDHAQPSRSHAGQVQAHHSGEHEADGHQLRDRDRIAEQDHPDGRRADGADPGPHRVGGPYLPTPSRHLAFRALCVVPTAAVRSGCVRVVKPRWTTPARDAPGDCTGCPDHRALIEILGLSAGRSQCRTVRSSARGRDTHPAVSPPFPMCRKTALPR